MRQHSLIRLKRPASRPFRLSAMTLGRLLVLLSPPSARHQKLAPATRRPLLYAQLALVAVISLILYGLWYTMVNRSADDASLPLIIVVTPTHRRAERLADMTRLSQTLSHVGRLHWLVVEDGKRREPSVERLLRRSGIPYVYLFTTNRYGYPKRGWWHRNMALDFIRHAYRNHVGEAVLYFADDDNAYDIRLFDDYIRHVRRIGVWAVGLAGGSLVEAPDVHNGRIVGWLVTWRPNRQFAVDMAGFAVNLRLVLRSHAAFNASCAKSRPHKSPESCFIDQLNVTREDAEPFGWDADPREILVWHTKTTSGRRRGSAHGYDVES